MSEDSFTHTDVIATAQTLTGSSGDTDLEVWDGRAEVGAYGGAQPAVVVVRGDVNLVVEQATLNIGELATLM